MGKKLIIICTVSVLIFALSGCNSNVHPESQLPSLSTSYSEISSDTNSNYQSTPDSSSSESIVTSKDSSLDESLFNPSTIKIGLYNGVGVWDLNVEAFKNYFKSRNYILDEINQTDLSESATLNQFDLIWFPGGYSAEYKYKIPKSGQQGLVGYVNDGGYVAGSCAGAYFMSDIMIWYGEDSDYPMKIFKGRAIGPLAGMVPWGGVSVCNINEEIFGMDFAMELPVNYFDGPYFIPHEDIDIDILARYEVNNEAAVIAGNFGKGRYLLFGPHPELGIYNRSADDLVIDGGEGSQWEFLDKTLQWFFT